MGEAIDLYVFSDYRQYIRADLGSRSATRGRQKSLADAAGCSPSYFSQVLTSHVQLTIDHAANLCEFWNLSEEQTNYFIDLVQLERAATPKLRNFLQKKISKVQAEHKQVSKRVRAREQVTEGDTRVAYYNNWLLQAVHVLASIPAYQSVDKMAKHLMIQPVILENAVAQLASMGFVTIEGAKVVSQVSDIHVDRDSPLSTSNHFQWRHRALSSILENHPKSLHYSTLYAASREDCAKLREMLLSFIESTRNVVRPSKRRRRRMFADGFLLYLELRGQSGD